MSISPEQKAEWKALMESTNMGDVLNGMLAIAECGCSEGVELLRLAGTNLPPIVKTVKNGTPDGRMALGEWRDLLIERLSK